MSWISKLRKIKKPLEGEIKENFVLTFGKWKDKYSKEKPDEEVLDFSPTFESIEESVDDTETGKGGSLRDTFENIKQNAQTFDGNQLCGDLQDISDVILKSHGALAARTIRQWISKLRSIRTPLEDDIRTEFLEELEKWKEKFT